MKPASNIALTPRDSLLGAPGPKRASKRLCAIRIFLCLLAAQWLATGAHAEELFRTSARLDSVTLGDRFEVILEPTDPQFDLSSILDVYFEADPEKWRVAEPWRLGAEAPRSRVGVAATATVQGFDVGEVELPTAKVRYRDAEGSIREAEVASGTVHIAGVLDPEDPQGEQAELFGLRGLHAFSRNWTPFILGAIGAAALLAAIVYLVMRRLRRARGLSEVPRPVEPELPPGQWALREIARRRRLPVCAEGPAKEVATLATEVVRMYFHRRFGFPALDMTTYECLRALRLCSLQEESVTPIAKYLSRCDLVKFSKYEFPLDRWEWFWEDAKTIVEDTTPAEELSPGEISSSDSELHGIQAA